MKLGGLKPIVIQPILMMNNNRRRQLRQGLANHATSINSRRRS
jgi:hypothetical protein